MNSQSSAQQLARLLLADPLGAEEQWEKELVKAGNGNEGAVLLKWVHAKDFGDDTVADGSSTDTAPIPTNTRQRHSIKSFQYPHEPSNRITSRSSFLR